MLKKGLIKKIALGAVATSVLATSGCQAIESYLPTTTVTSTVVVKTESTPTTEENPVSRVYINDFSDMIKQVKSSVVAINTEISYFSFYGTYTSSGAGSGWVFSDNGIIVTNNHVVEGASAVSVTFEDGSTYEAKKICTDPVTDLAVIFLDIDNLKPLSLGDSDNLNVGQWVVAIGNSLGMGISATQGIVSAVDVTISTEDNNNLYDLIQTTAAINPGNSGGPLFNTNGDVIGINSSKMSAVGIEGMAYAISINEALPIIEQLITNGKVLRPELGISMYTVTPSIAKRYQLSSNSGVLITSVARESVADKAGLRSGDVIVSVDDMEITAAPDLVAYLQKKSIGDQITIEYYHGNALKRVQIVLNSSK